MIMKRIFKRTLFIFMSILLTQSYNIQAAAAAAGVAGRTATDAIGAALPLMKTAAKEALNANAPAAAGFLRRCSQKLGAATMTYFFRPIIVLTKTTVIGTAAVLGLYGGGKLLLEKGVAIPVPAPAPVVTPKVEAPQRSIGNLLNNWNWGTNTPKVIAVDAGKKVAEQAQDWGPWIASITGLNYMKSTRLGKLAIANPKISKVLLAYTAAGYAYIHIVKRLQLNNQYKKFLTGIQAAQNGQVGDQSWLDCQAELTTKGFGQAPTILHALNYLKDLKASDINNGWAEWAVFPLHMIWSKGLANDKMLFVF